MTCANCDNPAVWVFRRLSLPFCDGCLPLYLRDSMGTAVVSATVQEARRDAGVDATVVPDDHPPVKPKRTRTRPRAEAAEKD